MARTAEQRAANESRFREANERLERKVVKLSITEARTPYFCECDDPRCTAIITLSIREYEAVRAKAMQFVIMPGHDADPDRVVEQHEGFHVIEKTGEEAELVKERDPRSSASGTYRS
jgi:hypothetical protein